MLYEFLLGGVAAVDPDARSLPGGVHGAAQVSSPAHTKSAAKRATELDRGEVFYEFARGDFTPVGAAR